MTFPLMPRLMMMQKSVEYVGSMTNASPVRPSGLVPGDIAVGTGAQNGDSSAYSVIDLGGGAFTVISNGNFDGSLYNVQGRVQYRILTQPDIDSTTFSVSGSGTAGTVHFYRANGWTVGSSAQVALSSPGGGSQDRTLATTIDGGPMITVQAAVTVGSALSMTSNLILDEVSSRQNSAAVVMGTGLYMPPSSLAASFTATRASGANAMVLFTCKVDLTKA